jgi:ketosteroid isomerase-like protein
MKHVWIAALFVTGSALVFGQAKPAAKTSVTEALKQIERNWGQAEIKKDFDAVDKILADDWVGIDHEGKIVSKAEAMTDMKSGDIGLTSEVLGPMTVRIFGNTAIVTGNNTEKSQGHGKDSSGTYVWTDVFVLRNGQWQVVASQSTKAE